jgi:hypothetical protein
MALTTYYYQWTGAPSLASEIKRVADAAATLGQVTFPVAIDVTVDSASKPALDVVMNTAGFVEVVVTLDASWGKLITVDSVLGDNAKGRRGGYPFATITAALAVAISGDFVLVGPGTYTESAGITIPTGVVVSGRSVGSVTIQALAVTVATDLVTMGASSRLEQVSLTITCTNHSQIRGIVFPGTTTATARVGNVFIVVDETGASAAGTSTAVGVAVTGTGSPSAVFECFSEDSSIMVTGAGLGTKRGILVAVAAKIRVARTSIGLSASDAAAATYYGIETSTNAAALVTFRLGTVDGGVTAGGQIHADISQTLGMVEVGATNLLNSNANALGLSSVIQSEGGVVIWGDGGSLVGGSTTFMRFGTGTSTAAEAKIRLRRKCVVYSLSIKAVTGPGAARTDTWTIRKNGVDTALTGSLTAAATSAAVDTISVSFADNDDLSLKVTTALLSSTTDVQVTVQCY